MKINIKKTARSYKVGIKKDIVISDLGVISLEADEQITFITPDKKEYDLCRKEWGYYATPSVNDRLKRFGFKTALVENSKGQIFIMLVEEERIDIFQKYLEDEENFLVQWLDEKDIEYKKRASCSVCPICYSSSIDLIKKYDSPPVGETNFNIEDYSRKLYWCTNCSHVFNVSKMNMDDFYTGSYAETTYKNKLKHQFEKIISLPKDKSDNFHRVNRVVSFVKNYHKDDKCNVLDIGSGLCVFLHRLKEITNWDCTALDPDARQASHAKENCGIESECCGIHDYNPSQKFDLVTMNKVLEHFDDPLSVLKKIKAVVKDKGLIYIEVPDGEEALKISPDREEFYVEHYHAFSIDSLLKLSSRAGLSVQCIERAIEPSGKYTIRMFCKI